MLIDKVLWFFASIDSFTQSKPDIQTIQEYESWNNSTDINRKKTAQTGRLMSNIYEKNIRFSGKIVQMPSINRLHGYERNWFKTTENFMHELHERIWDEKRNFITQVSIPRLPKFQNYFGQKTIIISDFCWSAKQINEFINTCKEGKARGIVIPLLTPLWMFTHPLINKYPNYIWNMEL